MKNYVWNIYFKWNNPDEREDRLFPSDTREEARSRVRNLRRHYKPSEIAFRIVKEPIV